MGKWNRSTELIHGSLSNDPLCDCFALAENQRWCAVSAKESVHSPCRGSVSVRTYTSSAERGRTLHDDYLKCVSERENSSIVKLSFHRPNQVSNLLQLVPRSIIAEESYLLVFPFTAIVEDRQAQKAPKVCDLKYAIFVHMGSALANHLCRKCHVILNSRKIAS